MAERVATGGIYIETERESLEVTWVGAYVEIVDNSLKVTFIGAYLEVEVVEITDIYGPKLQVI